MSPKNRRPRCSPESPEAPERPGAVALRYRPDRDRAPKVTATGSGDVAEQILQLARKHDIPIREDRNLIQVLSQLDPGQEIPPELYFVVAEVLSFVYWSARTYRREMAESYRLLGNRRFRDGDLDGAHRSWEMADSILRELNLAPDDPTD